MVFEFINQSGTVGTILQSGTETLTGSMTATLLFILLFLVVMAMSFGVPLEFISVIILPFCISVGAYYSNFLLPVVMIIIFVASIIAKNWLFR